MATKRIEKGGFSSALLWLQRQKNDRSLFYSLSHSTDKYLVISVQCFVNFSRTSK